MGFRDWMHRRGKEKSMSEEPEGNVLTLGFKNLPAGFLTKYQKARLNGSDVTEELRCVKLVWGDGPWGGDAAHAVLTFKEAYQIICQKVYIVELGKGEVK